MPAVVRRPRQESKPVPPPHPRRKAPDSVAAPAPNWLHRLAKIWVAWTGTVVVSVTTAVISSIKDTASSFVPSAEIVNSFVRSYPTLTAAVIAIGVLATVAAGLIVWREPGVARASQSAVTAWLQRPVVGLVSLSVATTSSIALVGLLALLIIRPMWCPAQICEPGLAKYPGHNDGYIGADVFAIQSDTILIQGDPATVSLSHLPTANGPRTVAAVLAQPVTGANPPSNPPYRLVAKVQNLRSDHGEMSIESIELIVTGATAPGHVNAWRQGPVANYEHNPFLATYSGQSRGMPITAVFAGKPDFGHVQLNPGESDLLTVRLWSGIPVDLTYQLQITYKYLGSGGSRTFRVPGQVKVVYASRLQWSEYELRDGKLQAA